MTDDEAEAEAAAASRENGASSAEPPRGTPPPERARYKGDAETVAMASLPLATTRTFVQDDESPVVSKAKIDPRRIRKLHAVLQALRDVDGKLSFTQRPWSRRSSCRWN